MNPAGPRNLHHHWAHKSMFILRQLNICQVLVIKVSKAETVLATYIAKLGSVVGPVIQENGSLSFEDDLKSGDLLYCVSQ